MRRSAVKKRDELAEHIVKDHGRHAPGYQSLADMRKFHAYLHRTYDAEHIHAIGQGGQRVWRAS